MKKIILISSSLAILLFSIMYTQNIGTTSKECFSLKVTPLKKEFKLGEQVILNLTFTNNKPYIDSLLNINEETLLSKTKIWNEQNKDYHYTSMTLSPEQINYLVFQVGESKTIEMRVNIKGMLGFIFFRYFPIGTFKVLVELMDRTNLPIITITETFDIIPLHNGEIEEFKEMNEIFSVYQKENLTLQNMKNAIDRSSNFLRKYPKSIYLYTLLSNFDDARIVYKYKYDESFAEDLKYYLINNVNEKGCEDFIGRLFRLIDNLSNKNSALEYLNNFKEEINDDTLKEKIDKSINGFINNYESIHYKYE
ncbi:MAG: hypothetical protein WC644_05930 [Ignavibacteria bacterium]